MFRSPAQLSVFTVPFMDTQHGQHVDPYTATEQLRAALSSPGIVLPSLSVDIGSELGLVELGRVRADVAARLADVIRQWDDPSKKGEHPS